MTEVNKEQLCSKIISSKELTALEKRYLEALVRADRNVFLSCPKCGMEMQHPPTRKLELLRDYQDAVHTVEQARNVCKEWQDNIRKIGTLRTEIAREPDGRKRLRLCILAIGAMTQDKVFASAELQRLDCHAEQ